MSPERVWEKSVLQTNDSQCKTCLGVGSLSHDLYFFFSLKLPFRVSE